MGVVTVVGAGSAHMTGSLSNAQIEERREAARARWRGHSLRAKRAIEGASEAARYGGGAPALLEARLQPRMELPEKRSNIRGSSITRLGAKTMGALPAGYTEDGHRSKPVDSFEHFSVEQRIPPGMDLEDHVRHLSRLAGVVKNARSEILAEAEKARPPKKHVYLKSNEWVTQHRYGGKAQWRMKPELYPEGTPKGLLNRAYNHAALMAMSDQGPIKYDFKMGDHVAAEMKPLEPFMRYVHRQLTDRFAVSAKASGTTHFAARKPYVDAFGTPFRKPKYHPNGDERKRLNVDERLVKGALFNANKHPRDKNGRFATEIKGAEIGAALTAVPKLAHIAYHEGHALSGRPARALFRNNFTTSRFAHDYTEGLAHLAAAHFYSRPRGHVSHDGVEFANRVLDNPSVTHEAARRLESMVTSREGMYSADETLGTHLLRGTNGVGAAPFLAAKVGDEVHIREPMSWTRKLDVAHEFADRNYREGKTNEPNPTVLHLERTPDLPVAHISATAHLHGGVVGAAPRYEYDEHVLGAGAKFRVVSKESDASGITHVHLQYLGRNAARAARAGAIERLISPRVLGRYGRRVGIFGLGGAYAGGLIGSQISRARRAKMKANAKKLAKDDHLVKGAFTSRLGAAARRAAASIDQRSSSPDESLLHLAGQQLGRFAGKQVYGITHHPLRWAKESIHEGMRAGAGMGDGFAEGMGAKPRARLAARRTGAVVGGAKIGVGVGMAGMAPYHLYQRWRRKRSGTPGGAGA